MVTLRKITLGRSARSQALLVADTARYSHEQEQVRTVAGEAAAQFLGDVATSRQRHHTRQPSFEISLVLRERGVAQRVSSPSDGDRAQKQALERWREPVVAAIDGELRVSQQMGKAHLPELGMAALGTKSCRRSKHADDARRTARGTTPAPRLGRIMCSTHRAVTKNPFPLRLLQHPHRRLVGRDHVGRGDRRRDGRGGRFQRRLRAGENVAQRALADRQAEHLGEQAAQPFEADRLGVMEIDRDGLNGFAERRAGLETFRRVGHGAFTATGAAPAKKAHTGDVRPDWRQFDAVVDLFAAFEVQPPKRRAQCGQASSRLSTTRSGLGSSARPKPGRLLRGGFLPAG